MGTSAGMIAQARQLLGLGESPPGSNHNKITDWLRRGDMPWCDAAISYEAAHSDNLAAVCGTFVWTVAHAKAFKAAGRWRYGLGGARSGDVVFFDWSGRRTIDAIDHVGLIEAVHADGTVTTLEGNTSDTFARRRRNTSCVVGYGRPSYRDAAPLPAGDGMLRRGSAGPRVAALQRNLNTALHTALHTTLAVDGVFGPATESSLRTLQERAHITVDGEYGPQSAAALRAALAGHDRPVRPAARPPAAGTLAVDGVFGPATCAALQRALNTHGAGLVVDAAFGPLTVKALQKHLGVSTDGKVTAETVRALQKRVGATQDGDWGRQTTRCLQNKLNAATF